MAPPVFLDQLCESRCASRGPWMPISLTMNSGVLPNLREREECLFILSSQMRRHSLYIDRRKPMKMSVFSLHLEDLVVWKPDRRQLSSAESSRIKTNLVGLYERLR